jgi:hypothetical protein
MSGTRRGKSERAGPHHARRSAPFEARRQRIPANKLSISMVDNFFVD